MGRRGAICDTTCAVARVMPATLQSAGVTLLEGVSTFGTISHDAGPQVGAEPGDDQHDRVRRRQPAPPCNWSSETCRSVAASEECLFSVLLFPYASASV